MDRKRGYAAIWRTLIDHPLFRTAKPLSRREAWEWLILAAAWQPQGHRTKFGIINIGRGQLCVTRRELAVEWRWSKPRVDRFLQKLAAESMIMLGLAQSEPKNEPESDQKTGYPRTLITICNYEKFQNVALQRPSQRASQKESQQSPELPGLLYAVARPKKEKNQIKDSKREREGRISGQKAPADGKIWNKRVWISRENTSYERRALAYYATTGVARAPDEYLDGTGNWFTAEWGDYERVKRQSQ